MTVVPRTVVTSSVVRILASLMLFRGKRRTSFYRTGVSPLHILSHIIVEAYSFHQYIGREYIQGVLLFHIYNYMKFHYNPSISLLKSHTVHGITIFIRHTPIKFLIDGTIHTKRLTELSWLGKSTVDDAVSGVVKRTFVYL